MGFVLESILYIIYPLMKYIIPLVVPSLQEFFLANRGGDHNSQTNAMVPTAARMTLLCAVSQEVKIQNSQC